MGNYAIRGRPTGGCPIGICLMGRCGSLYWVLWLHADAYAKMVEK